LNKKASNIIKKELKKRNITYKELASLLNNKYKLNTNENALRSSINRGKFSFEMAIKIFDVLNLEIILKEKKL
jgi:transposase